MRPEGEWHLAKPGSAGVPAGELGENCGKEPARRRRSQAEHTYLSAIRLKAALLPMLEIVRCTSRVDYGRTSAPSAKVAKRAANCSRVAEP